MAYIEWTDEFSVKVQEIDEQHKRLVAMINKLHEALLAKRGTEIQKEIIEGMIAYAAVHFETESRYMLMYHYPGYVKHNAEHEAFVTKALELQTQFKTVGFVLTLSILNFLKEWLQNHILGSDKAYSQCFVSHGLS